MFDNNLKKYAIFVFKDGCLPTSDWRDFALKITGELNLSDDYFIYNGFSVISVYNDKLIFVSKHIKSEVINLIESELVNFKNLILFDQWAQPSI